jgi:hypothetical protein
MRTAAALAEHDGEWPRASGICDSGAMGGSNGDLSAEPGSLEHSKPWPTLADAIGSVPALHVCVTWCDQAIAAGEIASVF